MTDLRSTPRRLTGLRVATSVADDGLVAAVSEDGAVVVDLLGRVQWSSPDWQPGALSPDGRYLVAVGATRTRLVNAVLDARTGDLVREIDWVSPAPGVLDVRWEDPETVLVLAVDQGESAILRIAVADGRGQPSYPAHVGRRGRHLPLPVREPMMTAFAAWLEAREPVLRRAAHVLIGDAAAPGASAQAAVAASASGHAAPCCSRRGPGGAGVGAASDPAGRTSPSSGTTSPPWSPASASTPCSPGRGAEPPRSAAGRDDLAGLLGVDEAEARRRLADALRAPAAADPPARTTYAEVAALVRRRRTRRRLGQRSGRRRRRRCGRADPGAQRWRPARAA